VRDNCRLLVQSRDTRGSMFPRGDREADRERGIDGKQRRLRQLRLESWLQAFRRDTVVNDARERGRSDGLRESLARSSSGIPPYPTFVQKRPPAGTEVMYDVAHHRVPHGRPAHTRRPSSPQPLARAIDGTGRRAILEVTADGEGRCRQQAGYASRNERAARRGWPIICRRRHAVLDHRKRARFRPRYFSTRAQSKRR
jgi:hypothetical protein